MFCSQCGRRLSAPGTTCTACATSAAPVAATPGCNDGEQAGPLLAKANLYRMRGQWVEAAAQCTAVIRFQPENPTAHSLLGDIYQDQGRGDDAKHWYQLALELNPASQADRSKLARVEEALEAKQHRAEWQAVIEGRSQPVSTSLLVRESLQRIGALAGAALCGIILVMAALVSASERTGGGDPDGEGTPPLSWMRPQAINASTQQEERLLKELTAAPGGWAQPLRVELDTRAKMTASVRAYVSRRSREPLTIDELRTRLLREAYRLSKDLYAADHDVKTITVSVVTPVLSPGGGARSSLLFIGTIPQDDLGASPDVVSPSELRKYFNEIQPPEWSAELAGGS